MVPASSKEFLDIQATIECGFTLQYVRGMMMTYSRIPFLIKFGDVRLEHDTLNVFMTFLLRVLRKILSVASFAKNPVSRPIWY